MQAALEDARNDNTADRLVTVIQSVLADAKETFQAATPAQINRLLEQFMGPVILKSNGNLVQKNQLEKSKMTTTSANAEVVVSKIAGARFDLTRGCTEWRMAYRGG
ncbi:MAG: hypothetical protein JKX85_06900 [Phycisphaeraceae bacterium]|nr:hypothetical protein [Phycisphaeraceae bacterium]